jgi:hypothetical protein
MFADSGAGGAGQHGPVTSDDNHNADPTSGVNINRVA